MAATSGTSTRVSVPRLIFLALVLIAGLVLFFVYAHRTPVVIHPDVEVSP